MVRLTLKSCPHPLRGLFGYPSVLPSCMKIWLLGSSFSVFSKGGMRLPGHSPSDSHRVRVGKIGTEVELLLICSLLRLFNREPCKEKIWFKHVLNSLCWYGMVKASQQHSGLVRWGNGDVTRGAPITRDCTAPLVKRGRQGGRG